MVRIKARISGAYASAIATLRDWKDALLNAIFSTLRSFENFIVRLVCGTINGICGFVVATKDCIIGIIVSCKNGIVNSLVYVKNGLISFILAIRDGILYGITATKDGIISIIVAFKGGVFCGLSALKNGILSGLVVLKNGIVMGIIRTKNAIYCATLATVKCIREKLSAFRSAVFKFSRFTVDWTKRKILEPVRNAYRTTVQFLTYWLCAHWWPDLKAWLILNVGNRLRRLFNYFCFGLVYLFCGYWVEPVGVFLLQHLRRFYAYFKRTVLIPLKM